MAFQSRRLRTVVEPTAEAPGVGVCELVDAYGVFGYGPMPDRLNDRGEAVCRIAAAQLEMLEANGIRTHFRRLIPPNRLECTLLREPSPPPADDTANSALPVEAVVRDGDVRLALVARPDAGLLSVGEASDASGVGRPTLELARELAGAVSDVIASRAAVLGLELEELRVELGALDPGELIVLGMPGSPDDARYSFDGLVVGKEVMREYYRQHDLEREVREWVADGRPRSAWPAPPPLPMGFVFPLVNMYRSLCEAWTGETIWGAPPLEETMETVRLLSTSGIRW